MRRGRLNAISLLVLLLFGVGLAVTFLTDDPRILLIKPSFFFLVVGAYMLAGCLMGRPLMYEFIKPAAAGGDPEKLARYQLTFEQVPRFRRMLAAMTAVWGGTWIVESAARVIIVYSFPPHRVGEALIWTILALIAFIAPALCFTIIYGRRLKAVGVAFNNNLDHEEVKDRTAQIASVKPH